MSATSVDTLAARRELDAYKVMCVKNYVRHIEGLMKATRAAAMELDALEGKVQPGGIAYDAIRVTTSPTGDRFERAVLDLVEYREQLEREQQSGLAQIDAFFNRLAGLKSEGGVIVRLHYRNWPDCPSYPSIGEPLGYSRTTSFRKRDAGYIELYDNGIPQEFAPMETAL